MPDLPILYSFRRCPFAMRARMALITSGTRYEHREILLRDKPAAMLLASPKGTVPVLVLPEGLVIEESLDIMRWALAQNDPEDWLRCDDRALIGIFDSTFKHHLDRYKYPNRYDTDPLEHRAAGLALLEELTKRLSGQSNLGGKARGFTDIALFPFIRQFAATDAEWFNAKAPVALREWLTRLVGSRLFEQAMVKFEPWRERSAEED